jgi:hypothetical protein
MSVDINVSITEDQVDIIATPTVNIVNVTNSASIDPGLYDLSEFTNTSGNPFVRASGLSSYVPSTRSILTTSPLNGGGDLSVNRTLSISQANGTTNGFLSSSDWTMFNNKQNALGFTPVPTTRTLTINGTTQDLSDNRTFTIPSGVTSVTGTAPIASTGGSTPAISIATANTSTNGALTSTDWNTFNGKQNALTLTTTGTSGPATLIADTLNIPQYSGGGGLQGPHVLTGNVAGSTFFGFTAAINGAAIATITPTTNRLDVYPFYPNKTLTNCSLIVNVSTLGVGVSGRIVVYADLNGYPNSKIYESTNLDLSTIGDKTALAGITFNAGSVYWLGFYANGSALMRALSATSLAPIFAANANTSPTVAWSRVGTTLGSAPDPFVYNTYAAAAQVLIFIKPA